MREGKQNEWGGREGDRARRVYLSLYLNLSLAGALGLLACSFYLCHYLCPIPAENKREVKTTRRKRRRGEEKRGTWRKQPPCLSFVVPSPVHLPCVDGRVPAHSINIDLLSPPFSPRSTVFFPFSPSLPSWPFSVLNIAHWVHEVLLGSFESHASHVVASFSPQFSPSHFFPLFSLTSWVFWKSRMVAMKFSSDFASLARVSSISRCWRARASRSSSFCLSNLVASSMCSLIRAVMVCSSGGL